MPDPDQQPELILPSDEVNAEPTVHHVSNRKKRGRSPANPGELQLTSMIDVIFQLLIYFVVTASFAIDEGVLTAKLPQGSGTSETTPDELPPTKIIIELKANQGDTQVVIRRDARRYNSFTELSAELNALRNDPSISQAGTYEPDNPILIKPDPYARWEHVVNAFNAVIAAKYTNVSFSEEE